MYVFAHGFIHHHYWPDTIKTGYPKASLRHIVGSAIEVLFERIYPNEQKTGRNRKIEQKTKIFLLFYQKLFLHLYYTQI